MTHQHTPYKWVIGNWKQNPIRQADAISLAQALQPLHTPENLRVGVAPSFLHIQSVSNILDTMWIGVQDICADSLDKGAFTGDVSAQQAMDMGVKFAIIGHSERRQYHSESHDKIRQKITHAQTANLTPILCIGESHDDYIANKTLDVLQNQLSVLVQKMLDKPLVIAYEPIWAIGTGLTPTTSEIDCTHRFIKTLIKSQFGQDIAVLYGGSVNAKNATDIAHISAVDGALVGGASLLADSFADIITAFKNTLDNCYHSTK